VSDILFIYSRQYQVRRAEHTGMDAASIRALTYNVRRDVAADDPYDWAGRAEAVASLLRLHRPDVIGLQEPLSSQYDDIREAQPGYEWAGRSRGAGEHEDEC
jgi:endonuclease/exonuclease/phosphatase family metal-dependent hydrolase